MGVTPDKDKTLSFLKSVELQYMIFGEPDTARNEKKS